MGCVRSGRAWIGTCKTSPLIRKVSDLPATDAKMVVRGCTLGSVYFIELVDVINKLTFRVFHLSKTINAIVAIVY